METEKQPPPPLQVKEWGVYKAEWRYLTEEEKDDDDSKVWVQFYKDGKTTYRLAKNNYRTEGDDFMFLEWFIAPDTGKTVHIFNLEHSTISVIDAESGEEIHKSYMFDMFIRNYKIFDDGMYLYLSGWMWSPYPIREIFHIPSLLTQDNLEGIPVPCIEIEEEEQNLNPPINLFGCSTCAEFVAKKVEIFDDIQGRKAASLFNKNYKDCFLWAVLHPSPTETANIVFTSSAEGSSGDELRRKVESLLHSTAQPLANSAAQPLATELELLKVKTIGNVSGSELSRLGNCLYMNDSFRNYVNKDQLAYYIFQIVGAPGFLRPINIQFIDFNMYVIAQPKDKSLPEVKFTMTVKMTLMPTESDGAYGGDSVFTIDPNNPPTITFS